MANILQAAFGLTLIPQALDAIGRFLTPGIPAGQEAGKSLSRAEASANTAKLGQPVREAFGTNEIFPDLLNQPRARFVDKREEETSYFLCVGMGECEIATRRIGQTPFAVYGASSTTYAPGADVSGDSRSECWYQAPEVGGSQGSAGLNLGNTKPSGSSVIAETVTFSGNTATVNGDIAEIPASWQTGTIINIRAPIDATVTVATRSVFSGDWQDVEPFIGMKVTVSTPDQDFSLVVSSWTDNSGTGDLLEFDDDSGSPFTGLAAGSYRVSIAYRGYQYAITGVTASTVTFNRLTDTGAVDSGWIGFTSRTVSDYEVSSDSAPSEGWFGPFYAVPEDETTDTIELDFLFNGLIQYDKDDGDKHSLTRTAVVQWRVSGGSWTEVQYPFTEKTPDTIGFTRAIDLGSQLRPQVRVRQLEAPGDTSYKTKVGKMQWLRLKAKFPYRPTSYAGMTTMAVTLPSGDKLAQAASNQINVIATRILGGSPTSSVIDAIRRVQESSEMPASQVDYTALQSLQDDFYTPRGDGFDFVFSDDGTVSDTMQTIMSAVMSSVIPDGAKISFDREGVRTDDSAAQITPEDMTAQLQVLVTLSQEDVFNGVDVKYTDPGSNKTETVECRLPGVAATRIEKIEARGVRSRTRAWRIGMRQLRKNLYQRLTLDCETELDARNYRYMQRAFFMDDIPGNGQTALVVGYSQAGGVATLELDRALDWSGLSAPRALVRDHEGQSTGVLAPARITDRSLTVPQASLGFTPVTDWSIEPCRLTLCESTRTGYDMSIVQINPDDRLKTTIKAVEYSDDYYQDDDNSPE